MLARKFRILFHNVEQGFFCTGSLLDEETKTGFTYVYTGGAQEYIPESPSPKDAFKDYGDINLLVLSDFNIAHIKRVIAIAKSAKIHVAAYPYMAPIQRQIILQEAIAAGEDDEDLVSFLKDPYRYFKNKKIIFVYPLMGNGPKFEGRDDGNSHRFELVDEEYLKYVTELEGYFQPIVRAGYILENHWLMFMGCYGLDLKSIRDLCLETRAEEERRTLQGKAVDEVQLERQMAFSYLSKFGRSSFGTVVLYSSPINGGPSVDDSMLMVKTMSNSRMCKPVLTPESEMCSAYCMYKDDHDDCKHHNQISMTNHIQGTLLLGTLNISNYRKEFLDRFMVISQYVRFYTIPNNGRLENWDNVLMNWGAKGHRKYWIGSTMSDANVIKDIVATDPYNRFMAFNNVCGICIFGFLAKLKNDRRDNKSSEHQL